MSQAPSDASAMLFGMTVTFEWRGAVRNEETNQLQAEGFDFAYVEDDWTDMLSRLSLGWVTARDDQGRVSFVSRNRGLATSE